MAHALPGFGVGRKIFIKTYFNKYLLCEDTVKINVQGLDIA